MLCSLILAFILFVILGFAKLVQIQSRACEAGVYHAPMTSPEEWSASLDVALGLDMWSTTEEEQVDRMWDMVPMVGAWVDAVHTLTVGKARTTERMHAYYSLRQMCYV